MDECLECPDMEALENTMDEICYTPIGVIRSPFENRETKRDISRYEKYRW